MASIAQHDIDRNNPLFALVLDFLEQVFQVEPHKLHELLIAPEETFDSRFRMKEDLYPPYRWKDYDVKIYIRPATPIGEEFHLLIGWRDNKYTIGGIRFLAPGWTPKETTPEPT